MHLWIKNRYRDVFNQDEINRHVVRPILDLQTAIGAVDLLEKFMRLARRLGASSDLGDRARANRLTDLFVQLEAYARQTLITPAFWRRCCYSEKGELLASPPLIAELCALLGLTTADSITDFHQLVRTLTTSSEELSDFFRSLPSDEVTSVWRAIGIVVAAPRIDLNVTMHRGHLLKLPFSVHPASRMVSCPFPLYDPVATTVATWPNTPVVVSVDALLSPNASVAGEAARKLAAAIAYFETHCTD
jgi:hypothetical protein